MNATAEAFSMGDAAEEQTQASDLSSLIGKTVAGRYQITRLLGEGGMGVVYSAIDTRLEKAIAIKLLKEDFAHRKDVVARFTQEAKSAARIKHENVMDVTDYGQTEDGAFYIAMEMLSGTDLADVIKKDQRIPLERAVNIMIQVGRALFAAHAKGVVHRDLKPENIFLVKGDDGRDIVKIVDFGIAQMKDASSDGRKLTQTGMVFGTPEYMSPEQAQGKPIDHRVDVYAVGVIMFEMFAGRVPFEADNFMATLSKHMFEQPPPVRDLCPNTDLTPDMEKVIEKSMAKDPEHRYKSMQELVDDLIRVRDGNRPSVAGETIPNTGPRPALAGTTAPFRAAAPTMAGPVVSDPPKSNKGLVVGGLIAVGLLAAGGVWFFTRDKGNNTQQAPGVQQPAVTNTPPSVADSGTNVAVVVPVVDAGNPSASVKPGVVDAAVVAVVVDAAVSPPVPTKITLSIKSAADAKVQVDGRPELNCTGSPCQLTVLRGEAIKLVATAGKRRGETTITPDQDGQSVEITLVAPATTTVPRNTGTQPHPHPNPQRGRCRPGQTSTVDPTTGLLVPCRIMQGH